MGAIASQITSLTIVYSTVYSDAEQRKHQSSASLAFVWGIHRWPVNSPHKWPVTRKMFPFDDVIMQWRICAWITSLVQVKASFQAITLKNMYLHICIYLLIRPWETFLMKCLLISKHFRSLKCFLNFRLKHVDHIVHWPLCIWCSL